MEQRKIKNGQKLRLMSHLLKLSRRGILSAEKAQEYTKRYLAKEISLDDLEMELMMLPVEEANLDYFQAVVEGMMKDEALKVNERKVG